MNILLVNWQDRMNPHAGGAEIHLFELFSRLAARGHRVRLIAAGWPEADARAVVDGIEVTRVGGRHSFALKARGAIRRAIAAERPDILVEDINKLPLFTTRLGFAPVAAIVPHLFGASAFAEASWPVACIVWLSELPIPRLYRTAAFHVISESTRDDLIARGIPASHLMVVHPGVDTGWYVPDPALDRTPSPSFLYVGRVKRYKGVDTAIRALALARRERPDLTLTVAGAGDDLPRIQRLAHRLGLEGDAVRCTGFVSEEEKRRLLRVSWATVLPSAKEGWGMTIVEAAACGTPSLASDRPGMRDALRDGVTGYLVRYGDPEALARRMLMLAHDRALVERLGQAARRHAETLQWDRAADLTEDHLRRIDADHRLRSAL